jgi:DNA-binding transcriptional MerR regulator
MESHSAETNLDEIELIPFQIEQLSFIEVCPSEKLNRSLEEIPDQLEFKIGHAADLVGVKPYVLRFWETEFDALKPKKSRKGQRVYSRRDVETAMMIKKLLYEDRFSIEGARTKLRELRSKVKEERSVSSVLEDARALVEEARSLAIDELKAIATELVRFRAALA